MTSTSWNMGLLLLQAIVILVLATLVSAGYNKIYRIPGDISACSTNRIREIDGASIVSLPSKLTSNSACILKLEADDDMFTSKRLMINFETLNFSTCDATLKIYFHRTTDSRSPDFTFTCNSPRPSTIYSPGKYVTFRLDTLTDRGYSFNIVVTSYKQTTFCKEFRCKNKKCIEDKLQCDGVNHCGDNSDEMHCSGVIRRNPYGRRQMGLGSSLASAFSSLVVVIICVALCVVCFRRRRAALQQGEVLQQQQTMVHTGVHPGVPPPGMGGMAGPAPPGAYPMGYQGVPTYNPNMYPPPAPGPPGQPPPAYGYVPQGQPYYPPPPNMYPPPPGGAPYGMGGDTAYPPPQPHAVQMPPPPGGFPVTYQVGNDQVKMQ